MTNFLHFIKKLGFHNRRTLKKQITNYFIDKVADIKNYSVSRNHYIFSDPRGGSTWMMEKIQEITQEPIIWEPLHLGKTSSPFNHIKFDWRQYIPEDEEWPEAKEVFESLFSGRILNKKILRYSTIRQLLTSDSLLFKICRGNALLPWLTANFQFEYAPIYLVRHPFAVVNSQIQHGAWSASNSGFVIPETRFNDRYKKHELFLKTLKSREEILVATWCLSNIIPLAHENNNVKWITITYEEFVVNPEITMKRILDRWKINFDLTRINFKQDSFTSIVKGPKDEMKRLSKWQNNFTDGQLDSMKRVLYYFQINCYSGDNPMPMVRFN